MSGSIDINAGIKCFGCGAVNWPTARSCMRCTAQLDGQWQMESQFRSYALAGDAFTIGKSFSQKVARFFEIADYILLIPGTLGLLYSLGLFPVGTIIVGGWYALGCLLLRGFYRHSRGRMKPSEAVWLWGFTFAYNLIDLLIIIGATRGQINALYIWPILVLQLSLTSFIKDRQLMRTRTH